MAVIVSYANLISKPLVLALYTYYSGTKEEDGPQEEDCTWCRQILQWPFANLVSYNNCSCSQPVFYRHPRRRPPPKQRRPRSPLARRQPRSPQQRKQRRPPPRSKHPTQIGVITLWTDKSLFEQTGFSKIHSLHKALHVIELFYHYNVWLTSSKGTTTSSDCPFLIPPCLI